MFLLQIKEFLNEVCEQIKYKPIRNEIAEELESHIEEAKEYYLEEGIEEIEAEQKAILQMGKAQEIGKRLNKIHKPKFNWQLLILTIILLEFGFILNIARTEDYKSNLILLILGLIPCIVIYFWDYKKWQRYSPYLYGIATIFLLQVEGRSYFHLGDYVISCSSIATTLYIVAFAGFLQSLEKGKTLRMVLQERELIINKVLLISVSSAFSILVFAMVANDIKSVVLLLLSYLIMSTTKCLNKNKKNLKKVVLLWGSALLVTTLLFTVLFATDGYMGEYRINRFISSFMPEMDPNGSGWQGMEAKKVMENANLFGEANHIENNTKALFNSESGSFPVISMLSNYGIVVSVLMVIMVLAFNLKILLDSRVIKDEYGKLLMVGISLFFCLRSIGCVLMNVNLGVKADFSIPFLYSGIELMIDMVCLAIVFSVYRRKDINVGDRSRLDTL